MSKIVYECVDPLGLHKDSGKPFRTKNKDQVRKVNADQIRKFGIIATDGYICGGCRHKSKDDQVPQKEPKTLSSKPSHSVYCGNFCGHPPTRQIFGQRFWKPPPNILEKCIQQGLAVDESGRYCFKCKDKIITVLADGKESIICSDPFQCHKAPKRKSIFSGFRKVSFARIPSEYSSGFDVSVEQHLCGECYKKFQVICSVTRVDAVAMDVEVAEDGEDVMELTAPDSVLEECEENDSSENEDMSSPIHEEYSNAETDYVQLVAVLVALGISVPTRSSLQAGQNASEIFHGIMAKVMILLARVSRRSGQFTGNSCSSCHSLVQTMKTRYSWLTDKKDKYQLLTCTPPWVSITQLIDIFGISEHMAKKVSKLKHSEGPLSFPPPKLGKSLPAETQHAVRQFYLSPDNGVISPAARDTIVIERKVVNGQIEKLVAAKQYLMTTMRQLYNEFRQEYPEHIVSISKFASLRPKQCVWGYKKGFQKSCLCTHHTNFELLLEAIGYKGPMNEMLQKFYCCVDSECMFGLCTQCPKWEQLDSALELKVDIPYWRWFSEKGGPGIELKQDSLSKDSFVEHFQESCRKIALHHYIYGQQKLAIANLIKLQGIGHTSAVMIVDYAQNYTFIHPNEVASAHWNHAQATILPFVMYYFCPTDKIAKTEVYTVISNGDVPHDATTFHVFRHVVLTEYVKKQFPWITSIEFISDGPGSQFKNVPNVVNLANMKLDYGIHARWTYSATGHGKGASDSFSAIAKRLTRLESLRRKNGDFILTVPDMVKFLNMQNRDVNKKYIMVLKDRLKEIATSLKLAERYQRYKPIKGIRQYHEIEPKDDGTVSCKKYSGSAISYTHAFKRRPGSVEPTDDSFKSGDFAAFLFNETFMVGMIQSMQADDGEYQVLFMKKCEKGYASYKWYDPPKEELISFPDMVDRLDAPLTSNGRTYNFESNQIMCAKKKFDILLESLRSKH